MRCFPVPNSLLARYIEGMKIVHKVTSNAPLPCGSKRCRSGDSPSTVYCTDCSKFLCERCHDGHEALDAYDGHVVKTLEEVRTHGSQDLQVLTSKNAVPLVCQRHKGKVLEYICEQCNVLMCQACAVDRKSPHTPVFLDDSVPHPHAKAMKIASKAALCFGKKCEKIEEMFQTQIRTVDDMKDASLVAINTTFQTIHEAVEKRIEGGTL